MKSSFKIFCLIFFILFTALSSYSLPGLRSSISNDDIKGTWEGTLSIKLRIVIRIYTSESGYLKAEMDSPDQKAYGLHLDTVIFDGSNIMLKLNMASAYYEGKYNPDSIAFEGNWHQNGLAIPLTLKKMNKAEEIKNLQERQNTSRLDANEVSIVVNGCKLAGTLKVPKSDHPVDVALIIAGSGPTDRDGNNSLIPGKNNSLKMISELLYDNNIASLRYDKRDIGASDKVNESDLTFDTYVNDAVEWVKYLKNDKRFSKIFIIGHSEGALIGMVASERVNIGKYASLCGMGEPAYLTIKRQLKSTNYPKETLNRSTEIMDSLKNGYLVKNVGQELNMLFRPGIQPYMISWFKYDPCKEISKLIIPVLIVEGTTDLQISVRDAEMLSKANSGSKLKIIKNMNHVLKEVPTVEREANLKTYSNPDLPLSKEFSKALIEFLKK
ncbi:MAG: alpha/beta hydrolase [Ignavibacteriaceae bacterium]